MKTALDQPPILAGVSAVFAKKPTVIFTLLISATLALGPAGSAWSGDPPADPFHLQHERAADTARNVEIGVAGMTRSHTNEFQRGWGGQLFIDVTRLSPFVFRLGAGIATARVIPGLLSPRDGHSTTIDLSILLRPKEGTFLPYAGFGLTKVDNSARADDIPEGYWPPDFVGGGLSVSYDLGSGFGSHVRGGLTVRVSPIVRLVFDVKWQELHPDVTFQVTELPSGREYEIDVEYNFSALYVSIGVSFAIQAPI